MTGRATTAAQAMPRRADMTPRRRRRSLLARTQQVFFFFACANLALAATMLWRQPAAALAPWVPLILMLCALLALWWWRGYRRRRFHPLADILEAAALLVIGFGLHEPFQVLGILNAAILFRSLYGGHWQALLRVSLFILVMVVILLIPHGAAPMPLAEMPGPAVAIGLVTVLARLLAVGLALDERLLHREQVSAVAEQKLMSLGAEAPVFQLGTDTARELMMDRQGDTLALLLLVEEADRVRLESCSGVGDGPVDLDLSGRLFEPSVMTWLREGDAVYDPGLLTVLQPWLPAGSSLSALVLPLHAQAQLHALLVVVGPGARLTETAPALGILASCMGLTLDSLRSRERFGALVQNTADMITIVSTEGDVLYQSDAVRRLLGFAPEMMLGRSLRLFIEPQDHPELEATLAQVLAQPEQAVTTEWRWRDAQGQVRDCETSVTNMLDVPSVRGLVLNSRDVAERKRLEAQLRFQASHDPLTGLANRTLFCDQLLSALFRAQRHGSLVGLLFLDLDDFKGINDAHGHQVGDDLLRCVAEHIRVTVRASDNAARFGGDEFAILLEDLHQAEEAEEVAARLQARMAQPLWVAGRRLSIHTSIGIALTRGELDLERLMQRADEAMYAAKRAGKNRYWRAAETVSG